MKLPTLGGIINEIRFSYPDLKFWDGVSKHEPFNPAKGYKHRQGMPNEIRIEFDSDDKEKNFENVSLTSINLWRAGYSFAVYYTDGGRSPHIHIYGIDEMDNIPKEQRTQYRKLFLKKYCTGQPDMELCEETHLCALEFVNHFKYNKPKALLYYFYQGQNQGMDYDLKLKAEELKDKKQAIVQQEMSLFNSAYITNLPWKERVTSVLTFEKVFDKYGVKYKGQMACCPFHNDTEYSLSFTNEKKLFHCFGCNVKGKIITLIKLLEDKKRDGNNKRRGS